MQWGKLRGYVAAAAVGAASVLLVGGALLALGLGAAPTGSPIAQGTAAPTGSGNRAAASGGAISSGSTVPPGTAHAVATLPASDPQSLGDADAPVVVEVWADFQCPFCGVFTHGLEPTIVREFVLAGTARLVFRDFPFLGPESMTAAVAARCAGQQGAFWRFHDLLFASQNGENQGTFSDALMAQLARYLQLDATAFSSCVRDPGIARAVEASRAEGERLGIAGTPTLRIIGPRQTVQLASLPRLPTLVATIDRLAHGLPAPTPISMPTPVITPTPAPRTSPVASAAR